MYLEPRRLSLRVCKAARDPSQLMRNRRVTHRQWKASHMADKSPSRRLDSEPGLCNFTIPYSRLHSSSPRRRLNLNRSMSAKPCQRELTPE